MNTQFLVVYGVFLGSILLSKSMKKKADMALSDDKRNRLAELMSEGRGFSIYVLGGLVGLFFANMYFTLLDSHLSTMIFFSLAMVFMLFTAYQTYTKITSNDFPKTYISSFIYFNIIQFVGFITLYMGFFATGITAF